MLKETDIRRLSECCNLSIYWFCCCSWVKDIFRFAFFCAHLFGSKSATKTPDQRLIHTRFLYTMVSALQGVGPRFVLPKISQRLTSVRPTKCAAFCSISNRPGDLGQRQIESSRTFRSYAIRQELEKIPHQQSLVCSRKPSIASLVARRRFSASALRARDHHFDTLKFVQRLKDEGFTEEQGVAMMKVLSDVIEERYVGFPLFCYIH